MADFTTKYGLGDTVSEVAQPLRRGIVEQILFKKGGTIVYLVELEGIPGAYVSFSEDQLYNIKIDAEIEKKKLEAEGPKDPEA